VYDPRVAAINHTPPKFNDYLFPAAHPASSPMPIGPPSRSNRRDVLVRMIDWFNSNLR